MRICFQKQRMQGYIIQWKGKPKEHGIRCGQFVSTCSYAYGNFQFQESGQLICYYLYNKDKGVRKDVGIVFEPILHEFVKSFFSNYSFGIPFRNTFFMKYSMKNMRKTLRMRYYEITSLKGVDEVYDGYSENSIANLIKRMNDMVDLPAYLSDK